MRRILVAVVLAGVLGVSAGCATQAQTNQCLAHLPRGVPVQYCLDRR